MAVPVYKQVRPNIKFLNYVRKWLRKRNMRARCILVCKINILAVVMQNEVGPSLICFYIHDVRILDKGGVIIFYDTDAMHKTMKDSVEDTFTNWLAQSYLNEIN